MQIKDVNNYSNKYSVFAVKKKTRVLLTRCLLKQNQLYLNIR